MVFRRTQSFSSAPAPKIGQRTQKPYEVKLRCIDKANQMILENSMPETYGHKKRTEDKNTPQTSCRKT